MDDKPGSHTEAAAVFAATITKFNKVRYTDMRQPGGRWAPAFPPASHAAEEAYIERMIARDEELGW